MLNDPSQGPVVPSPSEKQDAMNSGGMLIARAIAMLLVLSLVWGCFMLIPYSYRLFTNAWAAPVVHGKSSFTGTWVGTLYPPSVKAPDLSPSPYLTERNRIDSANDYELRKRQAKADVRVVMLDMSLDFFSLGSARLRGRAQVCDPQGRTFSFRYTTFNVSNQGMELMLYNDTQSQGGHLQSTYDGNVLKTEYHNFDLDIHGELHRGDKADFDRLCAAVTSGQQNDTQQ
jgi:hypothetical protein